MKRNMFLLKKTISGAVIILFLCLTGCSLLWSSPTSVVRQFIKLSEKEQNIEAMENLFSERAKRELGAEKIYADVLSAVEIGVRLAMEGESMPFLKPQETINGEYATITFYYHPTYADKEDRNNQVSALLIKENGTWKIYSFGQRGEPNPNPVPNSFTADNLYSLYVNYPTSMNERLTGKTIALEGDVRIIGGPDENDKTTSISIKPGAAYSDRGYILCNLASNAFLPYNTAKQMENGKIKIKGTLAAKDKDEPELVIENCSVQ